jgi:Flp pilus assembly protein TadD
MVFLIAVAAASCETTSLDGTLEESSLREVLLRTASAAIERDDYQSAGAAYRTLYAREPKNPDIVFSYARTLRYTGGLPLAIEVLDRALAERPEDARLLAERGKVELARSRPVKALDYLERSAKIDPKDWRTHSAIGVARDFMNRYAQARESYATALKLSPGNPVVLNNLALSQALSRKIDVGIATLRELVSLPDASAQARQNLALLHAWKGELAAAETLARRDLSNETVDNNLEYFRGLDGAAGAPGPATAPKKPQ